MACDVWIKCPFARTNGLPVGVKVLENVKVSEVVVWGLRLALGSACLKSLHLVVNEVGWGDLTSARYNLESSVKRYGSK